MFFLGLSPLEFFALLSALSGTVTAIYLLDKRRRKRIVPALHLWTAAGARVRVSAARRLQQPWSLVLQLAALLFLLLALAEARWGAPPQRSALHVLVIDTSIWSGNRTAANGASVALEEEKRLALEYLRRLPEQDFVLIAGADSLARPMGPATNNRDEAARQIRALSANATPLDLERTFRFAVEAQQQHSEMRTGEIAYIGPGRAANSPAAVPAQLRVMSVDIDEENCGFRAARLDRISSERGTKGRWRAQFEVQNTGRRDRDVTVRLSFNRTNFAPRTLAIPARGAASLSIDFSAYTDGSLRAALAGNDGLASDDEVQLPLAFTRPLRVAVISKRSAKLAPLLEADGQWEVEFNDKPRLRAGSLPDVVVVDEGSVLPATPEVPALFIRPLPHLSPFDVLEQQRRPAVIQWHGNARLRFSLRPGEMRLALDRRFLPQRNELILASSARVPGEGEDAIVVARQPEGGPRQAAIAFDPLEPALESGPLPPLLMAALIDWIAPSAFQSNAVVLRQAGEIEAEVPSDLPQGEGEEKVIGAAGRALPFSLRNGELHTFVSRPDTLQVVSARSTQLIHATLPRVTGAFWKVPASTIRGLPAPVSTLRNELWRICAGLALMLLILEWLLFRERRLQLRPDSSFRKTDTQTPLYKDVA